MAGGVVTEQVRAAIRFDAGGAAVALIVEAFFAFQDFSIRGKVRDFGQAAHGVVVVGTRLFS